MSEDEPSGSTKEEPVEQKPEKQGITDSNKYFVLL